MNAAKIALVEDSPPINTEVKARSRSMSKTEKYRPHVMISYSHADTDFCQQLVQALESGMLSKNNFLKSLNIEEVYLNE